jgi:hypothetical protein
MDMGDLRAASLGAEHLRERGLASASIIQAFHRGNTRHFPNRSRLSDLFGICSAPADGNGLVAGYRRQLMCTAQLTAPARVGRELAQLAALLTIVLMAFL